MSSARPGLPRSHRLTAAADFTAVLKNGLRLRDEFFTICARQNGLPHARLGLAISRRAAARAVARNRLKRRAREVFRHHQDQLAGIDTVVMAQPAAAAAPSARLTASLIRLWERIATQCRNS